MNMNSNNGEPKSKNKKLIIIIAVVAIVLSCSCCCCGSVFLLGSDSKKEDPGSSSMSTSEPDENNSQSEITITSRTETTTQSEKNTVVTTTETVTTTVTVSATEEPTESPTEPIEHRDGMNGISNKILSDDNIRIDFENSVRNDKTGNWKLVRTSDIFNIEEYALDYYKTYFKDNNEVHAIVNFTTETTSCVTCLSDYYIDVTIHEYVDKEEHDANVLFSGDVINEYFIYIDNGDIEKVR